MTVHPFIEAEKQAGHSVKRACELLKVSRAAFYARCTSTPGPRAVQDAELTEQITAVHAQSRGAYGAPHIHAVLKREGTACGRRRIARLMRAAGLAGGRRKQCGAITYIPTDEGWLYLATVIDIASSRVVGWATADHLRTELVADALRVACHQRRPAGSVIFHSDRGCQYTSREFDLLASPLAIRRPPRPVLGQRAGRVVLRHLEERVDRHPALAEQVRRPHHDL